MRFGVAQPVLLLVICLTACSSKPPPAWQPFPNGLDENLQAATGISEVRPAPDGPPPLSITAKPAEGAVFTTLEENHGTLFTIRNDSKKAIIVLRIEPVTNAGEGIMLMSCFPFGGPGIYDFGPTRRPLDYRIHESFASVGGVPAHACFLLPGQSFVFSCDDKEFRNAYFPVATKEVFAVTYIATEHDYEAGSDALNHWDLFCCDKTPHEDGGEYLPPYYRFVPFQRDEWMTRVAYGTRWPLSEEEAAHRCVVIRNMPKSAWILRVEVAFPWQEGRDVDSVGRQLAASLSEAPGEFSYCYCDVLKAYLVRQPDRTLLYQPADLTRPAETLLQFPPAVFGYDSQDSVSGYEIFVGNVRIQYCDDASSDDRHPAVDYALHEIGQLWGVHTVFGLTDSRWGGPRTYYVSIAPHEVHDFLKTATDLGIRILPQKLEYAGAGGIFFYRNGAYTLHTGG